MKNELSPLLVSAGLNEYEIALYFDLLKSPSRSIFGLISRTGFDKNQVYRSFERLKSLKMAEKTEDGIEARGLDFLVTGLESKLKKKSKLINRLKKCSTFLSVIDQDLKDFQILDTQEKILEKYIFMSEVEYDTCLDFGDLDSFIPTIGGLDPAFKFRVNRFKKSSNNEAICTTTGAYAACIMRKSDMEFYKSRIDLLKIDFKNKWIIFSDTNDYVLYNDFEDRENPTSVIVKSKVVADMERSKFALFQKNLSAFS